MKRVAALALAGCSNLLGLSPPHEQSDAQAQHDAASDAAPDAPGPGTVHVVVGGTAGVGTVTSDPAGISCPGTCDFTFPPSTQVTLSQTGGTGTFTGFHLGGCTGDPTCTITPDGDVTVFARWWANLSIIFVTSTVQHPGSFDSVANADKLCNDLASAAGVPGTFVAWLSTSTQSAGTRLIAGHVGLEPATWVRVDGALWTNRVFEDLEAGHIDFPARLDEFGRDVGDGAITATDTQPDGTAGPGNHCQDWASESDPTLVLAGEPAGGTDRWTSVAPTACNQDAHLYCLSDVSFMPAATAKSTGSMLFVTKGTLAGGAGIGAMDSLCSSEAQAANLPAPSNVAMVTPGGGSAASARLDGFFISGNVQRPDGFTLFPDVATMLSGNASFTTVPNVDAAGEFIDGDVWIGGGGFDNFSTDCNGWTSSSSSLFGTSRPAATTRDHTFSQQATCDQQKHVYCLNFFGAMAFR